MPTIISRDQVAENFSVSTKILARYEARGLVRVAREGTVEGYAPEEIRRLWTVLSLHRDLGINLAGIEAIMQLHAQLDEMRCQLDRLASRMREALDADLGTDDDAR